MQPSQLWIVWGSLLVSLGVYGSMPFVLPPEPVVPALEKMIVTALSIMGVVTSALSLGLRQFMLVGPARAGAFDPASPAGARRVYIWSLVCWVLSQSVGVYGLVLFFAYRVPALLYPFLGAAVALMLVHAPRKLPTPAASSRDLARPDVKIG